MVAGDLNLWVFFPPPLFHRAAGEEIGYALPPTLHLPVFPVVQVVVLLPGLSPGYVLLPSVRFHSLSPLPVMRKKIYDDGHQQYKAGRHPDIYESQERTHLLSTLPLRVDSIYVSFVVTLPECIDETLLNHVPNHPNEILVDVPLTYALEDFLDVRFHCGIPLLFKFIHVLIVLIVVSGWLIFRN